MSQRTHNWGVWIAAGALVLAILGAYKADADSQSETKVKIAQVSERIQSLETNLYRSDSMLPGSRSAFNKVDDKLDNLLERQVKAKTNIEHILDVQVQQRELLNRIYRALAPGAGGSGGSFDVYPLNP